MDEYVPMMIPRPIAKVNPLSPGPPKMYIISTTINVVRDVKMVLEIVWLMLLVIICGLRRRALPPLQLWYTMYVLHSGPLPPAPTSQAHQSAKLF